MQRAKVFISYSHKDETWKHKLSTHLLVLEKENLLELWCDRDIRPGQEWLDKIERNLLSAKVGILLISADFLVSEFVTRQEIPLLLRKHKQDGLHLVPVLLRECVWKEVDWLKGMQMLPRDAKPITEFSKSKVDRALADIAREVLNYAQAP